MKPAALAMAAAAATITLAVQAKPMNFYVPDTLPAEKDKPAKEEAKPTPKPESKAEKAEEKSEKPESSSEKQEKSAPPDEKKKPDEKPAKATPSPTPTPPPKPKATPKPAAATIDLEIKPRRSTELDPPLDPFGLARIFSDRWDFSSFLVNPKEELRFRLNAAKARTLRLARAFSALSDEVETLQRNLNSAALAAYLLSRDQQTWMPLEGRNLTEAQMLAVRATMRQDIAAMHSALQDYEALRNALNRSAEEVAALEKDGLDAVKSDAAKPEAVTIPTTNLAYYQTGSVLSERLVSVEALKASLAAEQLRDSAERRQSIASFAPPPPGGVLSVSRMPLPGAAPAPPTGAPRGETLSQPERTSTIVIETAINAPVHAVKGGVVAYAGPFRGYGNLVIVEHEKGVFSIYSHLANIQVLERQPVKAGTLLGRAGSLPESGKNGIQFQVRSQGAGLKPEQWLGQSDIGRLIAGN